MNKAVAKQLKHSWEHFAACPPLLEAYNPIIGYEEPEELTLDLGLEIDAPVPILADEDEESHDPFFPDMDLPVTELSRKLGEVRVICEDCPVKGLCLMRAFENTGFNPEGIWGGVLLTPGARDKSLREYVKEAIQQTDQHEKLLPLQEVLKGAIARNNEAALTIKDKRELEEDFRLDLLESLKQYGNDCIDDVLHIYDKNKHLPDLKILEYFPEISEHLLHVLRSLDEKPSTQNPRRR